MRAFMSGTAMRARHRVGPQIAAETINDEQFRAMRSLLVTIVILLGFITGILLAMAREYL
jgi:hypothetical protein